MLSPTSVQPSEEEIEEWVTTWRTVFARGALLTRLITAFNISLMNCALTDLIDSRIVSVDAETSVEDACEVRYLYALMRTILLIFIHIYSSY